MATLTTAVSGVSDTIHEDLGDVISRIDPSETPVYSMLRSRETVDNIAFSWLVQELAAASASNKVSEGAELRTAPTLPQRVSLTTRKSLQRQAPFQAHWMP